MGYVNPFVEISHMLFSSDYNYFLFINHRGIIACALVREFALWLAGKILQVWMVLCNNLHNSHLFFFFFIKTVLLLKLKWWKKWIIPTKFERKKVEMSNFDNWVSFSWLEIVIPAIGILIIICTYNLHIGLCSSCSNLFLCSKARLTKPWPFLADVAQTILKYLKTIICMSDLF